MRWQPLFLSLPLESIIKEHQAEYYHALEQADVQANSSPFIGFMLKVIAQSLTQNAPVNAPANAPVNIAGLRTPEAVLALLQGNPQLTRQQLAHSLGKNLRTIGRAIAKLQHTGKLQRIGPAKTGHWEVRK